MADIDLHLNSVLKRCRDIRFRKVEDEAVVLRQNAAQVMVLNEVGARILDLADGVTPICKWVDALFDEFEVDRTTLEQDVLEFAAEMADAGVLEPAGHGTGGGRAACLDEGVDEEGEENEP